MYSFGRCVYLNWLKTQFQRLVEGPSSAAYSAGMWTLNLFKDVLILKMHLCGRAGGSAEMTESGNETP